MKYVKLSAIVGLMLLVCVVGLLFYKKAQTTTVDLSTPIAEKGVLTEQASHVGKSADVLGDTEDSGVPRIDTSVPASRTNDNHIVAASVPHQPVKAEASTALVINSMPDSGHPKIPANESSGSNSKVEETMQDVEIYVTAAHADLEAKNVPVGDRTAKTSIQGDEVIVTFSPKPGERAGDFIVRIDRATGKVIDTKIWR